MNHRLWLNVGLLGAVLALGGGLYWSISQEHTQLSPRMFQVSPQDIKRIVIQRPRQAEIVLRKQGETWRMEAPRQARIESFLVNDLLAVVDSRSLGAVDRPAQLAPFELDPPLASVTFNEHTIRFGALNQATRQQYVLVGGRIQQLPPEYFSPVVLTVDRWLSKKLWDDRPEWVEIKQGTRVFRRDEGRWSTPAGDWSADDLNGWCEQWRDVQATLVSPAIARPALHTIELRSKSGSTQTLELVQRSPEIIVRRPDEGLDYFLPSRLGAGLLEPLLGPDPAPAAGSSAPIRPDTTPDTAPQAGR